MTDPQVTPDPMGMNEIESPTHLPATFSGCLIGTLVSFVFWALIIIVVAQIVNVLR